MLSDDIKKSILDASFKEGDKLPSVRQVADRLHLSVTTVHKVYKELADQGLVELVPGKGVFWGKAPSVTVVPEEDAFSVIEKKFQTDLESGFLDAFGALPLCKELSIRYDYSPYFIKKFLNKKIEQGVLRRSGRKYYFNEERPVTKKNYILFVHRCDEKGFLKIESERESSVFRELSRITNEQKIEVRFVGYHESSNQFYHAGGGKFVIKNDLHCLGVFLSTWLVDDASKLFTHFTSFENPISVWWEYAPGDVPLSVRNRKKWAFYNVAFGKEAGVIVGRFLKKKKIGRVHYISPYHASYWSKARLAGLRDAGIQVVPLVDDRFASPFDMVDIAENQGVERQAFLDDVMEKLLVNAECSNFVCSNDWVATTLIDLFRKKKLSVPYVVGFDDTIDSYRYVFDSFAFNAGTMVREALYHIVSPTIYAEQRRQMQTPLGRVVEKK